MEEEAKNTSGEDIQSNIDEMYHLLRVRIHKKNFSKLKKIAKEETIRYGEHVSVSDIVRGAVNSLIQIQETKQRLNVTVNPNIKPNIRKG